MVVRRIVEVGVVLASQCHVMYSIESIRHVLAEQVGPLITKERTTATIQPEPHKPVFVVLTVTYTRFVRPSFLHQKPPRCLTSPMRLERKDKQVRIKELVTLYPHSAVVENAKHITVCREPDDRDVGLLSDLLEQTVVSELINVLSKTIVTLDLPVHSLRCSTPRVHVSSGVCHFSTLPNHSLRALIHSTIE